MNQGTEADITTSSGSPGLTTSTAWKPHLKLVSLGSVPGYLEVVSWHTFGYLRVRFQPTGLTPPLGNHPRNKDSFILLVPPQETFKISTYTFFTLPLSGLSNLNCVLTLIRPCPEM